MKIGVLTSSRADFGIYLPLLLKLEKDASINLELIVFGTHLSKEYGYTINEILPYGFEVIHKLETVPSGDSAYEVSYSMGNTLAKFAGFWNSNSYDLVFCLGDRYEMFAAVSAGTPHNVVFAHIHAGETTLGAIDNSFRHAISHFSKFLFTACDDYKQKAEQLTDGDKVIYNSGALSIDNLSNTELWSKKDFNKTFGIDLNLPTILSTFHPETVNLEKNKYYIKEMLKAFSSLLRDYQIVITLPNADPMGQMIRKEIIAFLERYPQLILVESLGMKGYLSCMKYCDFMIGNTSSGFVEASFFPKFVINLGDRQKGRFETQNIFTTEINSKSILQAVKNIEEKKLPTCENVYGDGNAAQKIIETVKSFYGY